MIMNDKTRKQILDLLNRLEAEPLPSEVLEQLDYNIDEENADTIYTFILNEIKEREFEATQTLTRREQTLLHQAVRITTDQLRLAQKNTHNTGLQKALAKDIQEHMRLEEKVFLRMEGK